jgi:hypothetical protein
MQCVFLASYSSAILDISIQILDELIIAGELQESSKKSVLRVVRLDPLFFPETFQIKLTADLKGHTIR